MCPDCKSSLMNMGNKQWCPTCGWTKIQDVSPPRAVENKDMFRDEPDNVPGKTDLDRSIAAWIKVK